MTDDALPVEGESAGISDAQRMEFARQRVLERVQFIREAIEGYSLEDYTADTLEAKLRRGATRDAMVNLDHDVRDAGLTSQVTADQERALRAMRNTIAHHYVRVDDEMVWTALQDLDGIEAAALRKG